MVNIYTFIFALLCFNYKLIFLFYYLELYYGGEGVSVEQPQSLTCPYCTKMGFTEATLQEHVAADHSDTTFEVVRIYFQFIIYLSLIYYQLILIF